MKLIDKSALVAEIERRIKAIPRGETDKRLKAVYGNEAFVLNGLLSFIDTLEVKEIKENKLPNPRFPHLNNIIDKVFGTGNLESFEYEEAEQLVLIAKEELLKDLEVKEVDSLSLTWEDMLIIHKCIKDATNYHLSAFRTVEGQQKIYEDVLKRFKAQKGEEV